MNIKENSVETRKLQVKSSGNSKNKNHCIKMSSFDGLTKKVNTTEKRTNKLEDKAIEIT